ncbi:MAG: hypothetical protein HUU20_11345 [Pirellulales bacterium]|nr:hypothetical protein [Pirellulales bacterium]
MERARQLVPAYKDRLKLVVSDGGNGPFGVLVSTAPPGATPTHLRKNFDSQVRLKRQLEELLEHTQVLMREAEYVRDAFWSKADRSSHEKYAQTVEPYREYFYNEVIGRFDLPLGPFNARSRQVYDMPKYTGYEVQLDVFDDVFAYGILLVPKDIEPGERRPVVVCQHGLEGRPQDVADPNINHRAYHQYGCQLAERGFVVYAPQNPYIFEDRFRTLQRKLNPLRASLFSIISRQHRQILNWLGSLPSVDPSRIGFYGLSYGGKSAMRLPALLEGYALSICSGDFNDWVRKNVSTDFNASYMFTGEWEIFEWDLGHTFNYAEMAYLIFPRPFMVERGHHDGVGIDPWVAYEYAKVRHIYDELGLGDRTEIEYFNGPHEINGQGTYEFLHKHLAWPK